MRKLYAPRSARVYGTPYFSEGWALYAERVMRERGFFTEPIHELYHLEATIFRAARIIVDTSLHLGEMTFDEAVAFMTTKVAAARADGHAPRSAATAGGRPRRRPTSPAASRSCASAIASSRRAASATCPRPMLEASVLREFHDQLASSGALPAGPRRAPRHGARRAGFRSAQFRKPTALASGSGRPASCRCSRPASRGPSTTGCSTLRAL